MSRKGGFATAERTTGIGLKRVWLRSIYWVAVSLVIFAATIPVNLYQLNITGALPLFLITLFKGCFTAVVTAVMVSITYYGTLAGLHPRETWRVIRTVVSGKGAIPETLLVMALFMTFLAMIRAFWVNGVFTLVSLVAALAAIVISVRKFTVYAIKTDIVPEDEIDRYGILTEASLNNTRFERYVLKFKRTDNLERTPFMSVSTIIVVVGLAYLVQYLTRAAGLDKSTTDIVNLVVYYPVVILWVQARGLIRRWSVERRLRSMRIGIQIKD